MQITVYARLKNGYKVPLAYKNDKPITFSSINEALTFLYDHNFDLQTVKDLDFEIKE